MNGQEKLEAPHPLAKLTPSTHESLHGLTTLLARLVFGVKLNAQAGMGWNGGAVAFGSSLLRVRAAECWGLGEAEEAAGTRKWRELEDDMRTGSRHLIAHSLPFFIRVVRS